MESNPQLTRAALATTTAMAALDLSLVRRDAQRAVHQLSKRKNWAAREAGVVVVFCVVFIVVGGLIALFLYRKLLARRARRQTV